MKLSRQRDDYLSRSTDRISPVYHNDDSLGFCSLGIHRAADLC